MYAIYCAGEVGRVVLDILRRKDVTNIAFFDDDSTFWGTSIEGHEVRGGMNAFENLQPSQDVAIVAFGDAQTVRIEIAEQIRETGINLFSAIDPETTISQTAILGEGIIVNAQSYVGPGAQLADFVLLDSAVSIAHDVILETGVTIGPSATIAGGVKVGNDAYIGAGATVVDDVTIGDRAVLGAGAVVTESVPPETTVVGVPATPVEDYMN